MFTNQMVVASRIDDLHATAANERLAKAARRSSKRTSPLTGLWSLLAGAEKSQPMPKLTDYPFRS
jgi:hypothetical protein